MPYNSPSVFLWVIQEEPKIMLNIQNSLLQAIANLRQLRQNLVMITESIVKLAQTNWSVYDMVEI